MTQDELNRELDGLLDELVFNGDITEETSAEDIRGLLTSIIRVTEEQWQGYVTHCTVVDQERMMKIQKTRIQ